MVLWSKNPKIGPKFFIQFAERILIDSGGILKSWIKKLAEQFEVESDSKNKEVLPDINDDRATILYMIDIYNKNLFEVENRPIRRIREMMDEFSKLLMGSDKSQDEKLLFEFRQFFSSYRIAEYSYIQKTFEDFKKIIWDFADQLGDDWAAEKTQDEVVSQNLGQLREAVESNSIDDLKKKSREFINFYIEHQIQKDDRRSKRMQSIRKNLTTVKKQLLEANHSMRVDHLTNAYNRKSFDEQAQKYHQLYQISKAPVSLLMVDIDYFKKINDTYGHDVGDFVLKECVRILKEYFQRPEDFTARLGGEEFAVLLPDFNSENAAVKAEEVLQKIRKEVVIHNGHEIRFTVSIGISELMGNDTVSQWMKKADQALYNSKNTGRNKVTISNLKKVSDVA